MILVVFFYSTSGVEFDNFNKFALEIHHKNNSVIPNSNPVGILFATHFDYIQQFWVDW